MPRPNKVWKRKNTNWYYVNIGKKKVRLSQQNDGAAANVVLHDIFHDALGYESATRSPAEYRLERNFSVPGVGVADGTLGSWISLSGRKTHAARRFSTRLLSPGYREVQLCWRRAVDFAPDSPPLRHRG